MSLEDRSTPCSSQRIKDIIGSPMLFIVLTFLYPTFYLLAINSHIYTTEQIIYTLVFVFLISVIIALSTGISIRYFIKLTLLIARKCFKKDLVFDSSKLYRAMLGGIGTITLLILLHLVIQEIIFSIFLLVVLYLVAMFCMSALVYRFDLIYFNLTLCILIAFNCASLGWHIFKGDSLNLYVQQRQQEVVFKQKPNVYLVILESYASLDLRKEIYGIDNVPLTRELKDKKYDMYKVYSNYAFTLASVAALFLMDHHYLKLSRGNADGGGYRKIIGGVAGNRVIDIFLKNGYRIDYSKFDSSLYHPSYVVNGQAIQPLLQPIEVLSGFFVLSAKMFNFPIWTSEYFQLLLWLPEKISGKLSKTAENGKLLNGDRPLFSVTYTGADHTKSHLSQYPPEIRDMQDAHKKPLWELNHAYNYWITAYKNIVTKSDAALIDLVRSLAERDPDAVVILIGDHGPWFNKNRWEGKNSNLNENMLDNGIQPAEVTRDFFEVFVAIRWPHGTDKSHECFSHVNLFRHVFAILAKDNEILKKQVSNDSFIRVSASATDPFYKIKSPTLSLTVKDCNLLKHWEPFRIPVVQLQ